MHRYWPYCIRTQSSLHPTPRTSTSTVMLDEPAHLSLLPFGACPMGSQEPSSAAGDPKHGLGTHFAYITPCPGRSHPRRWLQSVSRGRTSVRHAAGCPQKGKKGPSGIEPETCRSAVDCSTTELETHACF